MLKHVLQRLLLVCFASDNYNHNFLIYAPPGTAVIEDRSSLEKARLLANAKVIVKHGWKPSHFMIDKSLAEKSAIRKGIYSHSSISSQTAYTLFVVFQDVIIRVCQFHIIQAIRRWDYDLGAGRCSKTGRKTGKCPRYQKSLPEETQQARSHTVDIHEPRCTCTEFDQTGKFCGHLWAVHWYQSNGPVDEWEGEFCRRNSQQHQLTPY
jgi:hypothetical protein